MKWGQRTKLDELVLHEPRLAQGQLFHLDTRLFDRRHVQEEDGAWLSLANPPLVDLASQYSRSVAGTSLGKSSLSCSGVGGFVKCPIARIFVVGTAGKGRFGKSFVSAAFS